MSDWLASAVTRAETVNDWLSPKRLASLQLLRQAEWPSRKVEAWKYTPVKALERMTVTPAKQQLSEAGVEAITGLNSLDLLFVDGELRTDLSSMTLPDGLTITSLIEATGQTQNWAVDSFNEVKPPRHLFGLVNDVLATSGLIVDVSANVNIEPSIRIMHVFSEGQEVHNRVLVRVGANAKLSVIEQYNGSVKSFNTGFAEYELGEAAELNHYRFALQTGSALSVGGSHFKLSSKAQLNSTLVGFGSQLSRLDVDVRHCGEHANAKLNAIYLLDGTELFDLHSTIEHEVPNGTTEENVRGIVGGHARVVFNGRIHIHRDAQKTLAELNNRNLLMSDDAEINTKPELEIYADDVRCAHGATIAQIDKKALYYLQSRGIQRGQAQVMLSFGFINELVDQMPNEALAEWLRPQLRQRFVAMDVK